MLATFNDALYDRGWAIVSGLTGGIFAVTAGALLKAFAGEKGKLLVKDEWTSPGQLSYQDGRFLYVAGGYGQNSSGKWVTFDLLTKPDLPQLITSVIHGDLPAAAVSFTSSSALQSTGGELTKLSDGFFYLVMRHRFIGSYTAFEGSGEHNAEVASQTYLNEIRKLKIGSDPAGHLTVSLADSFCNEAEFHRRDLNVLRSPILAETDWPFLVVYLRPRRN